MTNDAYFPSCPKCGSDNTCITDNMDGTPKEFGCFNCDYDCLLSEIKRGNDEQRSA